MQNVTLQVRVTFLLPAARCPTGTSWRGLSTRRSCDTTSSVLASASRGEDRRRGAVARLLSSSPAHSQRLCFALLCF